MVTVGETCLCWELLWKIAHIHVSTPFSMYLPSIRLLLTSVRSISCAKTCKGFVKLVLGLGRRREFDGK